MLLRVARRAVAAIVSRVVADGRDTDHLLVALARNIRRYRDLIANTWAHNVSNARTETANTHLRVSTNAPTAITALEH